MSELKAYFVEMTVTAVVMATNADEARYVAKGCRYEIMSDADDFVESVDQINSLAELRGGWCGECLPYGGDGNTRLKDILCAS